MFKSLDTVWCPVSDMNRAVAFYRDVIGLEPGFVSPYWSSFKIGEGIQLGLHGGGSGGEGGFVVGFLTDDLPSVKSKLLTAGYDTPAFHDIPRGAVLNIKDPDGNLLQATQLGVKAADIS